MSEGFPDRETFDKVYGPYTMGLVKPNWWLRLRMRFWPTYIQTMGTMTIVYKKHNRVLYVLAVIENPTQYEQAGKS